MAASTAQASRVIDPRKTAKYTVHLSDALLRPLSTPSNLSTIQFNTKPSQTTADTPRATSISSPDANGVSSLSIRDDEPEGPKDYAYTGARSQPRNSYVLIFDESKHSATLEPLSNAYAFNLSSAPWESNSQKLAKEYPQLHPPKQREAQDSDDEGDDLFEEEDMTPDADNPFDFRHFLIGETPSSPQGGTSTFPSAAGTPARGEAKATPVERVRTMEPKKEPKKPPRKEESMKLPPANRKRKSPSPKPERTETPIPQVRLDRRASTRETTGSKKKPEATRKKQEELALPSKEASPPPPSSPPNNDDADFEDDEEEESGTGGGGLTIDFGDSGDPRIITRRAFGLDLQDSNGPISLHSAANSASPASRQYTPYQSKNDDDDVMEFGDRPARDDDEDGDVDSFELGSPAVNQGNEEQDGDEDDDDGLEAELMQGLQDYDEDQGQMQQQDSGSESEEE